MNVARTCGVAVAVLCLLLGNSPADKKEPWEWTDNERVEMRLDPLKARDRVAASRRGREARASAEREPYDVIDGHQNPELFFPVQLFHSVVKHGFIGSGQSYRDHHLKRAMELGLPGDLWDQIAVVSAPFISDLRRQRESFDRAAAESSPSIANDASRELSGSLCVHGAVAYRRLRSRFGVVFDRFLYETTMPGMTITYVSPPTEAACVIRRGRANERGAPPWGGFLDSESCSAGVRFLYVR